ncbi:hypothetical protein WISP_74689 [Willisornis vidua]|uniref:Uncharacterized protein n=1 Tax=Willisornis vidua TaxID=1566151 RepID=A0ABQ9D9D1_9PASS|nr:hypothetical protein WISP_74689 [Willisornis vidua]
MGSPEGHGEDAAGQGELTVPLLCPANSRQSINGANMIHGNLGEAGSMVQLQELATGLGWNVTQYGAGFTARTLPKGVKWLIHILSDLIFATTQSIPVSTELQLIEYGDPGKYEDEINSISHYECLRKSIFKTKKAKNLTGSGKQIAEFFGFSPAAEKVQTIAEKDTIQAMTLKAQEIYDAVGLILFCQGVFGDWNNLFTEALNQEMDAKF